MSVLHVTCPGCEGLAMNGLAEPLRCVSSARYRLRAFHSALSSLYLPKFLHAHHEILTHLTLPSREEGGLGKLVCWMELSYADYTILCMNTQLAEDDLCSLKMTSASRQTSSETERLPLVLKCPLSAAGPGASCPHRAAAEGKHSRAPIPGSVACQGYSSGVRVPRQRLVGCPILQRDSQGDYQCSTNQLKFQTWHT